MQEYETTFVIDSLIKHEEVEDIIEKTQKFIQNNGGEIINIDRWGKKRLAYELKKRQYGYYVLIEYKAPEHLNKILEREYMLDENILRYLIVKINYRAEKSVLMKKTEVTKSKAQNFNYDEKHKKINDFEGTQELNTPEPEPEPKPSETATTEEAVKEE